MASANRTVIPANTDVSLHPRATDFILVTTGVTQLTHTGDGSTYFNIGLPTGAGNEKLDITEFLLHTVNANAACELYYRIV